LTTDERAPSLERERVPDRGSHAPAPSAALGPAANDCVRGCVERVAESVHRRSQRRDERDVAGHLLELVLALLVPLVELPSATSGPGPAKHGRISKQGSAPARYALVEAAWSVVRQPGPLRAFYERIRARRGHQVAIVASAQAGLPVLVPAHARGVLRLRPAVADQEEAPPARAHRRGPNGKVKPGIWAANKAMRQAERELAH
jgi:hypothetical protein